MGNGHQACPALAAAEHELYTEEFEECIGYQKLTFSGHAIDDIYPV